MSRGRMGVRELSSATTMPSRFRNMDEVLPQACERCWTRKQKCDRAKPSCQQCRSASTECVERLHGNVLDPDDPEAHHSYIEALKRRVARLETRAKSSPAAASTYTRHGGPAQVHTPVSTTRSQLGPPQRDNLQIEMGYLSLSAMAELSGDLPSSSPAVSFPSLVQATTCVSGSSPLDTNGNNEGIIGSLGDVHRTMLKQGNTFTIAARSRPFDKFIAFNDSSLGFMDSAQLSSENDTVAGVHELGSSVDVLAIQSLCKVMRVYIGVATGILLGSNYRYTESYATALAVQAFQVMPRAFAGASDLDVVQSLTAMTAFSTLSPFGGSPWQMLGLAITRCISAGMHTARVSDPLSDDVEKRGNSQAFWSLFTLDAVFGVILGRPFCMQRQDISVPVPSISLSQENPSGDYYAWNIQHAMLLHDIRRHPSKGILYHWSNFRHWREIAPINPQNNNENAKRFREHQFPRSSCRGLLAILQISTHLQSTNELSMILEPASNIITAFFKALEQQVRTQDGAYSSLDGVEVFSATIGLLYIIQLRMSAANTLAPQSNTASHFLLPIQKPLQLLARISDRFTALLGLGEMLQSFAMLLCNVSAEHSPSSGLGAILDSNNPKVPHYITTLMLRTLELRYEQGT